jgi:hypothetical protein
MIMNMRTLLSSARAAPCSLNFKCCRSLTSKTTWLDQSESLLGLIKVKVDGSVFKFRVVELVGVEGSLDIGPVVLALRRSFES